MKQQTFTDIEYSNRRRKTRRDEFLMTMDKLLPWDEWVEQIRPYYPDGKRGRKPKSIETMLRMYLMQDWFHLSSEGTEDVIYDSYAMRSFLHIDFVQEQVPSASTLLRFRQLLKKTGIQDEIRETIQNRLQKAELQMHKGTLIDASLTSIHKKSKQK